MSMRRSHRRPTPTDLEICMFCGRDFVNPVEWEEAGEQHWWMLLRCGECDTWREVTVSNAVAERFDVELDRRAGLVSRAVLKLDLERMAEQVETFVEALRRGWLLPADFAV
jgi:hypothetical protein